MSARPRSQPFPWQKLFGALFISGAVIGLVGNALHPHTVDLDAAATVQALAGNGAWVAIHVAIILLLTLWTLALGILMWREHADTIADTLPLAPTVADLRP